MNRLKSTAISVQNHVNRHRGLYGFATGAITMYAINRTAVAQWNEFLEEKGLTDEFYCPEM